LSALNTAFLKNKKIMELLKKTVDVQAAIGWYLMKDEKRFWKEDFADEDTGAIVTPERSEVICGKCTQINEIIASMLTENGILQVEVSNTPLLGWQNKYLNLWEMVLNVTFGGKRQNKSYFVTAECPAAAEKFISEFFELNINGSFELVKVSKLNFNVVIKIYETELDDLVKQNEGKIFWYKCQMFAMIDSDDSDGAQHSAGTRNILVQATSFENAIAAVKLVNNRNEYDSIFNTFRLLQELNIEEVFIPEEKVNFYSNNDLLNEEI
jgi:hypothetical protein